MDETQSPDSTGPQLRLLLVDDNPDDADRVREMLAEWDGAPFEVEHARRVEDALQILLEARFDVVLLDLGLEETEGIDTLARAKVAATTLPFVVMSTDDDEHVALRAHRFGAQDYLVKGEWDSRLLVRTLRHAVERHRILTDLTRARQHEHYLATHDGLTGLPNRLALMDQLHRTLAYSSRSDRVFAVLFLDLDGFKHINDSLGHPVGDELLVIVAERLSRILRRSDMLARLGGDEFIILLQDVKRAENVVRVAQKITAALAAPCKLEQGEYRVTASIGIAVYPDDGRDADVLIRNADTAMYAAKAEGPNHFSYYAENMNRVVRDRLALENGLKEAVEFGSFRLHYQPQIDVIGGQVLGAEALIRWQQAERGLVGPGEFISAAEEAGLIRTIGTWVLRTACQEASDWQCARGEAPRVAVNVSARQLSDREFPDLVSEVLRETGLPARRLELELTEHTVLQERSLSHASVKHLRELGVGVVIDDFGTGYSALSALKHLPVDGLKIDRTFVAGLVDDDADATITSGLLGIAQGLGLRSTAEGVETRDQRDFLLERGCRVMQGFLFAKPMEAEELRAALASQDAPWDAELPDGV